MLSKRNTSSAIVELRHFFRLQNKIDENEQLGAVAANPSCNICASSTIHLNLEPLYTGRSCLLRPFSRGSFMLHAQHSCALDPTGEHFPSLFKQLEVSSQVPFVLALEPRPSLIPMPYIIRCCPPSYS